MTQYRTHLSPSQAAALVADIAGGMTKAAAARKHGIKRSSVYRYLNRTSSTQLKPCGTVAAYKRHKKKGESCIPCSVANANYEYERTRK